MKMWATSLAGLLVMAGQAMAQQPAPPSPEAPAARNPVAACKADMASLCKEAPSGLAGKLQCLKTNQDKLSPECMGVIRAVLGAVSTKAAAIEHAPRPVQACKQELATLCPDVAAGEGGRIKCLRDNGPRLSPACADSLKAARVQAQDVLKTCNADRERLCGAAGSKPADQLKCLREKQADLGSDCRALVASVKAAVKKAGKDAGPALKAAATPAPPAPPAPPAASSAAPAVAAPASKSAQ